LKPRDPRNWSIRSVRAAALMPAEAGAGWARAAGRDADGPSHRLTTGEISYASRLMLSRCRGEMLSEVMFPPYPPQPRVMAGSRPVDSPTDPWVVGELTTMRNAGLWRPNSRITWSFREWIDIVCPMPPYRRICLQRSHPSCQSLTT